MRIDMLEGPEPVWAAVAEVVDAVEAELDVLVASVEDRVMARMPTPDRDPSAALHESLRRGASAAVRDALSRLRCQAGLPQELLPDLVELARVCAESRWQLPELADG